MTRETADIELDVTLKLTVRGRFVRHLRQSYDPPAPSEPAHYEDVEYLGPDGLPLPVWLIEAIEASDGDALAQDALLGDRA